MRSKLFQKIKVGYGYDQSGEVLDKQQQNIEDTSEPQDHHETEHNAVNLSTDAQAVKDFPTLGRSSQMIPPRHD